MNRGRANASLEQVCAASSSGALSSEPVFFDGCIHFYRKTKHQSSGNKSRTASSGKNSATLPIVPARGSDSSQHAAEATAASWDNFKARCVPTREAPTMGSVVFDWSAENVAVVACVVASLAFFLVGALFFSSFLMRRSCCLLLITRDRRTPRDEAQPASRAMRRSLAEIQGSVE